MHTYDKYWAWSQKFSRTLFSLQHPHWPNLRIATGGCLATRDSAVLQHTSFVALTVQKYIIELFCQPPEECTFLSVVVSSVVSTLLHNFSEGLHRVLLVFRSIQSCLESWLVFFSLSIFPRVVVMRAEKLVQFTRALLSGTLCFAVAHSMFC